MAVVQRLPNGCGHQLVVDGQPFLARAAELNNSSLSSSEYMAEIWPKLVAANVNVALGSVTWDQIEPVEGQFDFSQLDKCLHAARQYGIRLVLLWFGSFKNGMSSYVPKWVKRDSERFPRAEIYDAATQDRQVVEVLTLFHPNAVTADCKAFKRLLEHLKSVDGDDREHKTVLLVQVENEVGLLGDSRDRSDLATRAFTQSVPTDLTAALDAHWDQLTPQLRANLRHWHERTRTRPGMSWEETFGSSAQVDEIFMAYHYAKYVEQVAAAGKSRYDIPMYTNVWLRWESPEEEASQHEQEQEQEPELDEGPSGGAQPGRYPSGGGIETVIDIWQMFAPSLSFISPDIYNPNYEETCANFTHRGQPLFIPEQQGDEYGMIRTWYAIGNHGALATSPFGIDYAVDLLHSPITKHYKLLAQVSALILSARQQGRQTYGFFFDRFQPGTKDPSPEKQVMFGTTRLTIKRSFVYGHPEAGFGLVIQLSPEKFLLIGEGFRVYFTSTVPGTKYTGIASFVERKVVDESTGAMETVRLLNGDETKGGQYANMPSENPDYADCKIWVLVPARTRIAECSIYSLH